MKTPEINKGENYIGLAEALSIVLENTNNRKTEMLPLSACTGYVSAEDIIASVSSPTDDASLKDGFAVKSCDVASATFQNPVKLSLRGAGFAGVSYQGEMDNGQAIKICSGSLMPAGTDAVVVAELCDEKDGEVLVKDSVEAGKNVLRSGEDVKAGARVFEKDRVLLPAHLSLIAAAGISQLSVYRKPRVAIIAAGNELIAPGEKIKPGQLYASNAINLGAWLSHFNIAYASTITIDDKELIKNKMLECSGEADVILTCGGAWESERDLIVNVLEELGWNRLFRHVRMGPGKGVSFGKWGEKRVFCLPGGPPSNEIAFIYLALPGILNMAGLSGNPLCMLSAELTEDVKGRSHNWTEFMRSKLTRKTDGCYQVTPFTEKSRLKFMAGTDCFICKPEGVDLLPRGQLIPVKVMNLFFTGL
jgi:molybdopterin molybdotransferase